MKETLDMKSVFEKIAGNDPWAFQLFFDYTYSTAFRYANYFVADPELCKDILSDVYAYIWQHRTSLTKVEKHSNYLFICVKNRAVSYIKDQIRHQKIRLEMDNGNEAVDDDDPEQRLLNSELTDILELAINSLPRRCRLIYFMVREEGMKYRDVAEILQISERTVQSQMYIAMKRLTIVIKEYLTTNKHSDGQE